VTTNDKQIEFTVDIANLILYARDCGITLSLRECWRSPERQYELVKAKASKTHYSEHLNSLAVDFVMIRDGEIITDGADDDWVILGAYWKSLGHVWGGDWGWDANHFEYGGH
jgi:hypothetical protein